MKKPTDLKPIQEQVTRPQQKAGAALRSTPRLRPRSTDWDAFEARLAKTLSELEEDQHMELCLKHSNRYVQFMAQGSYGLRMETTSNAYLDKKEQYNRTERARMLNLGWSAPTGAPARATPENDPDGSPNFFIQWEVPLDCVKVAALAVQTLIEIIGAFHPGWLEFEALDANQKDLPLPSIGLKRVRHELPEGEAVAEFRREVLRTLRSKTGIADLQFGEDSMLSFAYQRVSIMCFTRSRPAHIWLLTVLMESVRPTAKLLRRINELNTCLPYQKINLNDDVLVVYSSLPGQPFAPAQLIQTMQDFVVDLKDLRDVFQAEFGRGDDQTENGTDSESEFSSGDDVASAESKKTGWSRTLH